MALATASKLQTTSRPPSSARLWGLTARQLHDAYWHSRGVQCVVHGQRRRLQRAAEIFLLLEPGQLAVFDIAEFADRLQWHDALVTRVRLADEDEEAYSEQVCFDESGWVQRIERRYRPRVQRSSRVLLTRSRRLAELWLEAADARSAWRRIRRVAHASRVDHWRGSGLSLRDGDAGDERRLIGELVARWTSPGQSIAGLVEREPGVWQTAGDERSAPAPSEGAAVRIGPLWIGNGAAKPHGRCIVGPRWFEDAPDASNIAARTVSVREIAEVELARTVGDDTSPPVQSPLYLFVKRLMDVVFSLAALVLASPLMLLIVALILLEDGRPVFFSHRRQGRGGRAFKCLKFRTMHRDAEGLARALDAYNICDGRQVYIQDDPRVTRVGKLLRESHVDELPQLINVLLGHMSLVGPRPSPDDENQLCPAWRDLRLSVRPGITGLWQLHRTREPGEDFQEWIKYDVQYVQQCGLWTDIAILWKTAWMIVLGR